ncbi:UvrD-helicase domain-containing protein [Nannocystis sp.]|uniref:UvrD-helicase domain-containing protein n=1 Tax=Nannocystis sp. TaxID=1962667 RepID=UPI002420CD60|nr:UvrD-helicase domain-containing protein [Nannocystis sp.]MBK7824534.1 UvrD-helicase domain-containing protein [Nannocystis sp.]MBK9753215.1 UvrD-helicase domain-containing protein [Nannocystis sp.]
MSTRRTASQAAAPEALWLFSDNPQPAVPARPEKTTKPASRKGPRKPRGPRASRDLFTAVGTTFARSSEAARAELAGEAAPAQPRHRIPSTPQPVPPDSSNAPVLADSQPVPTARHPVLSDSRALPVLPDISPVPQDSQARPLARGPADDPVPWETSPADDDRPWPDHEDGTPWSPPAGELRISLVPGAGPRTEVLAILRDAEDVASAPMQHLADPPLAADATMQHVSILASAGSGKTYQLTNRYLQILARGAAPYSILASTFTRAAAGEIRDRILRTLAESADTDDKRHELGRRLHRPELSRQFVLDLLTGLAHNLHRLQIRTLDSFFGTIVRCFALELGLPADARIIDEDEAFRLRRSAIQRMLEEGDEAAIIELLASLTEGSSERAVTDTIDNTVSALYDLYREARYTDAWHAIPPGETLTEAALDHAIAELQSAYPAGPKRTVEAHAKDCERAEQCRTGSSDDWMEFFANGLAAKIADGTCVYYGKPIDAHTVAAYRRLLHHARGVYRRRVIDQTSATHELLERFDECYQRVKHQHKALTFADLTVALAQADLRGQLDDICYRIDARLRHVLLDEMQDTSIQQWNAMRPIVDETVSYTPEERSFFCVGDVKQSIYGWRNACPEILSRIDQLLGAGAGIVKQTLATSYRSAPAIIDAVNQIFGDLAHNPALLRYPDAAARWDEEFTAHTTTRHELAGYVRLRTVARCEDQAKRQNLRLQEAAALVAELYARHPGKTIGVLLRTNGAVGRVLYELGPTRLKIPATGRGGGPLTDAPAVNAILDLLRLADHPDHSVAAFNVLTSPLGPVVGLHDDGPGPRHRTAARVRRLIASDGLARTLQPWIKAIAGQVDERQYRRCMQLIQLAQTWDQRASLRCDDFVAMVEARAVADPAASAVQVMTIHQAKGLEFDIVILPELEAELASTRTLKVVYERDGDAGPISKIARHVSKDMWSIFDDLRPMFEQHIGRLAHESLCLLYVAVTRAREGLFMLIDPPAENSRSAPARMSSLVLHALRQAGPPAEPDSIVFTGGDLHWLDPHAPVAPAPQDPSAPHLESPQTPLCFAPTQGPLLRSAATSNELAGRTVGQVLGLGDGPTNAWGDALRALFAQVAWLEEWNPDRRSLVAAVQTATPSRDETWATARVEEFLHMLAAPTLRRALSRGNAPASALQVERQVPFARLEGGALQTGEIPRVVLELATDVSETTGPEGQVIQRATVLGFCLDAFDDPNNAAERAAERAANWREPMAAWRAATAEQWGIPRDAVAGVLLFVNAGLALPLT